MAGGEFSDAEPLINPDSRSVEASALLMEETLWLWLIPPGASLFSEGGLAWLSTGWVEAVNNGRLVKN